MERALLAMMPGAFPDGWKATSGQPPVMIACDPDKPNLDPAYCAACSCRAAEWNLPTPNPSASSSRRSRLPSPACRWRSCERGRSPPPTPGTERRRTSGCRYRVRGPLPDQAAGLLHRLAARRARHAGPRSPAAGAARLPGLAPGRQHVAGAVTSLARGNGPAWLTRRRAPQTPAGAAPGSPVHRHGPSRSARARARLSPRTRARMATRARSPPAR